MDILTPYRRDVLAKVIFDLFKISVGAAFASRFFADFRLVVKLIMVGAILILGLLGLLLCPKKQPVREG